MKQQNNASSDTERYVPVKYICSNGTVEVYPGYMVSDHGHIVSVKGKAMKTLKLHTCSKYGHLKTGLCINGKMYYRYVHCIVLSSFHPGLWSKDTNEVDHFDRDPANNYLGNLHWTDRNGNCTNRVVNPLKKIRVTHLSDGHIEEFDNMRDCSRAFHKCPNWCDFTIRYLKGFCKSLNILIEKI